MSEAPEEPPPQEQPEHHGIRGVVRDFMGADRGMIAVLVTVPVVLTALEYYGLPWHYTRYAERRGRITGSAYPPFAEHMPRLPDAIAPALRPYVWWGLACLVLMVLIPTLVGWASGTSPRKLGVRLKGTGRDAWTYALLYVLFLPVIWMVSRQPDFQKTYPFFKPPGGKVNGDFVLFEVVYCSQFFAIEYFFRGFIVLGLKPKLGIASVFVMLAPYCMVHYYKPFPEAMGAIGAGVVLGLLAWRTGTILYGWCLHYAVALSMDLLAMKQAGLQ